MGGGFEWGLGYIKVGKIGGCSVGGLLLIGVGREGLSYCWGRMSWI